MNEYVLIVDDDHNLLRGLARGLRNQPYQILTARSAEEAEHVVRTHPVAVIVSDEHMSGKPGTEMLGWVAENCPEIVRIVLTGFPNAPTVLKAAKEGHIFRFFSKPFDTDALATAIYAGLRKHREHTNQSRTQAAYC